MGGDEFFTKEDLDRVDEAEMIRREYMQGTFELSWIAGENLVAGDRVRIDSMGKLRRARAGVDPIEETFVVQNWVRAGEIYSYKSHLRSIVGVDPAGGPDKTVVALVQDGKVQILQEDDGELESYVCPGD